MANDETCSIDLKEIMIETECNKIKSIIKLRDITGLSLLQCKAIFNEPYELYYSQRIIPSQKYYCLTLDLQSARKKLILSLKKILNQRQLTARDDLTTQKIKAFDDVVGQKLQIKADDSIVDNQKPIITDNKLSPEEEMKFMNNLEHKVETWKKRLLDLGKRNRLINYINTKRSNVNIIDPEFYCLYEKVVVNEETLTFPYPKIDPNYDENDEESTQDFIPGNINTNRTLPEQQKTLRALREKAKTVIEEQGVNVLYMIFGFLHWSEVSTGNELIAPIVLVPVSLKIEAITQPYTVNIHDDEIVTNPTLAYKLENDFGITLPEFDAQNEKLETYIAKVRIAVENTGWQVEESTAISILSFLKINMYHDLIKNEKRLKANTTIRALSGDTSNIVRVPEELQDYDHDKSKKPLDVFQVVDADSSQQDAILLSKKGISFVLQGPPGTGKSQTITNIISEALADGKKVLFVSEKMAALEVVHRRLTSVGLSDFCLILHSHKANKKQVLSSLGKTLNLNKIQVREEAMQQLEFLSQEREKLNKYAEELHTKCEPLKITIYEANGRLAKLNNAPDLIFEICDVGKTTPESYRQYIYSLDKLSKSMVKLNEDYTINCWRGCNVLQITHELRHDLENHLTRLIPKAKKYAIKIDKKFAELEFNAKLTENSANDFAAFFKLCSNPTKVPYSWIENDKINELILLAEDLNDKKAELHSLKDNILQVLNEKALQVNGNEISIDLEALYMGLKQNLSISYVENQTINIELNSLMQKCSQANEVISQISGHFDNTIKLFELDLEKTKEHVTYLYNLALLTSQNYLLTESWLDVSLNNARNDLLANAIKLQSEWVNLRNNILSEYEKEIFSIDFRSISMRFKTEYTSFTKIFNKTYKDDKNKFKGYHKLTVKKIADESIIKTIDMLKRYDEIEDWFNNNDIQLKEYLGENYVGKETDYLLIKSLFVKFSELQNSFAGTIPKKICSLLLNRTAKEELAEYIDTYEKLDNCSDVDNIISCLNSEVYNDKTDIIEIRRISLVIKSSLNKLLGDYVSIGIANVGEVPYADIKKAITNLCQYQAISHKIDSKTDELKEKFNYLYNGIETNWDTVINALKWASEFICYIKKFNIQGDFIRKVLYNDAIITDCNEIYFEILEFIKDCSDDFAVLDKMFDSNYQLGEMRLISSVDRMERCAANLAGLEEWIDFRNTREHCNNIGLADFVNKAFDEKILKDVLIDSFCKRFYRLWLDAIMPLYPSVYTFRSRAHDSLVKEFADLDLSQMKIAQSRVREKLISRLPNLNGATSAVDEVGILKRELAKQRKIMPLRILFAKIPTLLPSLKPCLMMSPLSVSLFLQSDNYNFDVVIFDEASQVCTENAVGAIMRGNQVIIAGDSQQLPPTNFFATAISDFGYDVEDENNEDDSSSYESVLDEAVAVLVERSLKWHYRSRNEELIAFSNAKIYNHSLVTFPSNIEHAANNGVEYVYVENGVYDRSGNRNNPIEANMVAQIVFEHIKKNSTRSIGVITFSEAQQSTVDAAIRKLRIQNPQYESLFDEEKNEPFFIKNLENVQGDERDTIILSIGYAKDNKGVMYNTFGPLNKNGGYRRLNVAITRAKFNIKLVGSINPSDIKVSDTSPEGIKMLRSYIEFAINGHSSIENELTYNSIVNVESPFEESVYDFLVSKNYNVITQVGCSGYRIDMAVKHPTINERFVIGIECDGATYHSARTARERDRLRQSVLEDIGWKIYRVWSTDWIKDSLTEGEKLVEAIENAITSYKEEEIVSSCCIVNTESELAIGTSNYDEIPILKNENDDNPFGMKYYKTANIWAVAKKPNDCEWAADIIKHILTIEQPINFDVLCKRIAPLYGNQKATTKISEQVKYVIDTRLKDTLKNEYGFISLINASIPVPRKPKPNDIPRTINHVCASEIAELMRVIISQSFGITKDSLYQVATRELGYKRSGQNIMEAMDTAYQILALSGHIGEIDGKLTCK